MKLITQPNIGDTLKAVLIGEFIAIGMHIKQLETVQIND